MKLKGIRWSHQFTLLLLIAVAFLVSVHMSRHFLDPAYLLTATTNFVETGLMALAMTFVILLGEIDLSVASNLALTAALSGVLWAHFGWPLPVACMVGLVVSAVAGLANGLLVTRLKLPSLTVTLGSMALLRGAAQVLIGNQSITGFPDWFAGVDQRVVGPFPAITLLLLVAALAWWAVLTRTIRGRMTQATGANRAAARLSGISVEAITVRVFMVSGLMAGFCGLIMMSRVGAARWDMAQGRELDVITAVVLGGTDIAGGEASIPGTMLALILIAVMRTGMGLAEINPETQHVAVGILLAASIAIPNLLRMRNGQKAQPAK